MSFLRQYRSQLADETVLQFPGGTVQKMDVSQMPLPLVTIGKAAASLVIVSN